MNARAHQLLQEAHAAYRLSVEYQRRGYALEEQAKELLDRKRILLVMPVIDPTPTEGEKRRQLATRRRKTPITKALGS